MTRRAALVALGIALLAAACGNGHEPAAVASTGGSLGEVATTQLNPHLPTTVTSADGRTVTVTDISRIVPLAGNVSEVIFALGLGDNVVGRDISATFEEAEDLPMVTRAHDVSAESVLSLRPTLVLADPDTGPPEALAHIRNVGVPVVVLEHARSIDAIAARIRAVAEVLGVPGAGDDLVEATEAELAEVREAIPDGEKPRVAFLYLRGSASVYLIGGPGSGTDSMIAAAGGIDAGTEMGLDRPFTPLTAEAMAKAAPDVILVTTTGLESVGGVDGLVRIPGVAQTPAAAERRVITVEDGLLFSFGRRTPDALRQIIEQLYDA